MRLDLEKLIEHLSDWRKALPKRLTLAGLLWKWVYATWRAARTSTVPRDWQLDPTFRRISSQRIWDQGAALTSALH